MHAGSTIRYNTLQARIHMNGKNFRSAEQILEKTRSTAIQNGMLRSACDLALLRVEALLAASRIDDAIKIHKNIELETKNFPQRLEQWEKLKKEIIARA